jgi:hypothetical protein
MTLKPTLPSGHVQHQRALEYRIRGVSRYQARSIMLSESGLPLLDHIVDGGVFADIRHVGGVPSRAAGAIKCGASGRFPQLMISPPWLERSTDNRSRHICSCSGVSRVHSVTSPRIRSGALLR